MPTHPSHRDIDNKATLYNLDGKERCEVLLRGRHYGE